MSADRHILKYATPRQASAVGGGPGVSGAAAICLCVVPVGAGFVWLGVQLCSYTYAPAETLSSLKLVGVVLCLIGVLAVASSVWCLIRAIRRNRRAQLFGPPESNDLLRGPAQ